MQITFLGTSASEVFPDPFCRCNGCEGARREGGRSLRLNSAALINDDLLIDLGPTLGVAAMHLGIDLAGIRHALQTPRHEDHLDALTLGDRRPRSGQPPLAGMSQLRLHCSHPVMDRIDLILKLHARETTIRDPDTAAAFGLDIVPVAPWQEFRAGPYRVQSVAASHDDGHEAMLFAIEDTRDRGTIFYGTDTGPLAPDTWTRLADLGWVFDLFILDHSFGFGNPSGGHLNADQFLAEISAARAAGVVTERTRVIGTHLAHHSHPAHSEMAAWAEQRCYEVAWDGWTVATPT
jgi:phosphoribosyl 1,2-cyclic phosphodiesterase